MGCAPSLRMVHQSNAYFEQCHAADFDSTVTADMRQRCWSRWLQHYTHGQPPDRVEYARSRVASLEDGEDMEPLPGMQHAAVGGSATASFFPTTTPARRVEARTAVEQAPAEGDGDAIAEDGQEPGAQQDTVAAPDATVVRTPVWEEPRPRHETTARRVIQPDRELPEPPDTLGACAQVCTPRWNDCMSGCEDRPASCREACETEHRTCMRGCF